MVLPASAKSGFITLISVVIIGAVGAAIAVSLLWLGTGSTKTALALQQKKVAESLVNACVDEGLQRIRSAAAFTGANTLLFPTGSCTYTVASQGGSNRTVAASGVVGTVIRRSSLTITQINPRIIVSSWQEVGGF